MNTCNGCYWLEGKACTFPSMCFDIDGNRTAWRNNDAFTDRFQEHLHSQTLVLKAIEKYESKRTDDRRLG